MKKLILKLGILAPALVLTCACAVVQNTRLAKLALNFSFETGAPASKAIAPFGAFGSALIAPEGNWLPARFEISGIGPGGAAFIVESDKAAAETSLVPGDWSIKVRAFAADDKEVAAGSSTCTLQPAKTTNVHISLCPVAGNGDLSLSIEKTFDLPAGAKIVGRLLYRGLPGQAEPESGNDISIDIPAEQKSLSFEALAAGYYTLALQALGTDGVAAGGCVYTVLIVAGFSSPGVCSIRMGVPTADVSASLLPSSPLAAPLLSVPHRFAENRRALPLAVSRHQAAPGETLRKTWYANGESAGEALLLGGTAGLLPAGTLAFPPGSAAPGAALGPSLTRADLVEESPVSHRAGSAFVTLKAARGPQAGDFGWKAGYDYTAAMAPSLYETTVFNQGTGSLYALRAAAASPSGLIVVSGMDEEAALHAFAAPYGADLQPSGAAGPAQLPIDASWLRLWRDKIKIGSSYKSADRLAVSADGRRIAAASSASDWLRLSFLDEGGRLLDSAALTSASSDTLSGLKNIRALCFSADGAKLYAACSAGDIYAFDIAGGGLALASSHRLWKQNETETLSLQDLKLTSSGALVVTASEVSRIYVLADSGSLAQTAIIQKNAENDFQRPSSLAVAEDQDTFYVLCDKEKILCYARLFSSEPYRLAASYPIPVEARPLSCIAFGATAPGARRLIFAAGGGQAACFEVSEGGALLSNASLSAPPGDISGMAAANGLGFCRGAFILSGGSSGILSVFGVD